MGMSINFSNTASMNNYYGQSGMGGATGIGQQPQIPRMMGMMMGIMMQMMQMMQMVMGGSAGSMMGNMPGMGGMPGGFTPMVSSNLGNFLGMPAGGGFPSGGANLANGASPAINRPNQQTLSNPFPAQQAPNTPVPVQQTPSGNQKGKAGQTKTGPPPGYKSMKGKIPSGVVAKAKSLLNQPMGKEVPFTIDGKNYMARLETHYHPPGYKSGPNGYHKGVTVYEQA